MVYLEVYSKNTQIIYLSTICSKTTFFVIITGVISVIAPLIIAYNTKGLWLKTDSFYTQPRVKYTYEYFFHSEDDDNTKPLLCSNIVRLENTYHRCSSIKVYENDYDYDGKYDELHFNLSINNDEDLNINSFILIIGLDIQIQDFCEFQFKTFGILQYSDVKAGEQFNFIGDLKIIQRKLVSCQKNEREINFNGHNFDLWDFMKENSNEFISTKIENSHTMWLAGKSKSFLMDIIIRYPFQHIFYKPSFWQVIKFAWIQYLSIFIALTWFINKIKDYIFTNKLLLYHVDCNKR